MRTERGRQLFYAAVMLILAVAVAFLSKNVYADVMGALDGVVERQLTIAATEDVDISGASAAEYGVRAVKKAFDESGQLQAYIIESCAVGFNPEKEIAVASTITADGKLLCGIEVLEHAESEYFGDRISTSMFTDRFTGRWLPVVLTGEAGRGAHIDALSNSTISSKAVLKAVDNAYDFLNTELL